MGDELGATSKMGDMLGVGKTGDFETHDGSVAAGSPSTEVCTSNGLGVVCAGDATRLPAAGDDLGEVWGDVVGGVWVAANKGSR